MSRRLNSSANAHPKSVTLPLEEATMEPSSPTVYSAEMLSCRNKPSGSFFCRAYHFPAYCQDKVIKMNIEVLLIGISSVEYGYAHLMYSQICWFYMWLQLIHSEFSYVSICESINISNRCISVLTLCGSKSCLTVKLSTTQVARLCCTQARNNIARAKSWKSILDKTKLVCLMLVDCLLDYFFLKLQLLFIVLM